MGSDPENHYGPPAAIYYGYNDPSTQQANAYFRALENYDPQNATQAEAMWLNFLSRPNSFTSPGTSVMLNEISWAITSRNIGRTLNDDSGDDATVGYHVDTDKDGLITGMGTVQITGYSSHVAFENAFNAIKNIIAANQGVDRYNGYDKSIPVENYNCAGLAFRTYQWMGLDDVKSILNANKIAGHGNQGDIKVWLWTYNVTMTLKNGNKLSSPSPDFHVVAGRLGINGTDPSNVFSKNGGRPVFGPGSGPSFKPLSLEPAYSNDRFNTPVYYQGQQVMKVRTEIIQQVFILPYKQY